MSLLINAATKHQAGELAEAAKLYNEYIEKNAEKRQKLLFVWTLHAGYGEPPACRDFGFQKR